MKKTFDWLDAQSLKYEFNDYKKNGVSEERLSHWSVLVGWQKLLNTKGTTWRKQPESTRTTITEQSALRLMLDQPSVIKRPVIEFGAHVLVGFDEKLLAQVLTGDK